jgi:D-alanyl-D-alanine carboxypeptidase
MFSRFARHGVLLPALLACGTTILGQTPARCEALLVVEVESGKVLYAENATVPWYPASITKIMTVYATLRAIKEGRLKLDTLLTVSSNATAQAPVKMGFPRGTTLTVDNALKMLLVKSANDMAVVLAEGVAGSIENFADVMNAHARRLGMVQSHFVNPNGLPADEQIVSARDMAILARAAIKEFPEYDDYWHLPGIRMGKMVQRNYNTLIGRYPGADGMKTGFICASGFNLVATATRDGRRIIAVVLGAPSSSARAIKAAQLLERGFTVDPLRWLTSQGQVEELQPANVSPPDLREQMCGGHRKRAASEDEDDSAAIASLGSNSGYSVFLSNLRAPASKQNLLEEGRLGEPVLVFTGSSPKKPGESRAAVVTPKKPAAKSATSNTATAAAKSANEGMKPAAAKSAPWSSMSPGSLADSPPSQFNSTSGPGTAKKPAKKSATAESGTSAQTSQKTAAKPKPKPKAAQAKPAPTQSSQGPP